MGYVPLYDGDRCIGRVNDTNNLDYWDGHTWTCGSTGRHLGVGKTRAGRYYLVYGTQWQGERDRAEVVSEKEAQEQVMKADNEDLYMRLFGEPMPTLD